MRATRTYRSITGVFHCAIRDYEVSVKKARSALKPLAQGSLQRARTPFARSPDPGGPSTFISIRG